MNRPAAVAHATRPFGFRARLEQALNSVTVMFDGHGRDAEVLDAMRRESDRIRLQSRYWAL